MANESRVFIGRLPNDARERDVDKLFRDFKVHEIVLKQGYGFVDLDSAREAVDACHDLNGKTMMGSRIVVEMSKPKRRGDGDYGRGRDRYDSRGGYDRRYDRGGRRNDYSSNYGGGRNARGEAPYETKYRLLVENLHYRSNWKDLKDLIREASFADAHKKREGTGIVCFDSYEVMKRALDKYDGEEINGKKIRLVEETKRSDRSRSRSPRRSRSRSRSNTRSPREARKSSRSLSSSNHGSRSRSRSEC
uniref:RRM domain-containing protein n=1 Tax=Acrobeloides nanus TaxID=290746 RepID=A0A914C815_9BILA